MMSFSERLAARAEALDTDLCVGLDPRREALPVELLRDPARATEDELALAYLDFCRGALEASASYALAAKPQVAFFEALGAPGFEAYLQVCRAARELGLPVIADIKRGDIGTTAEAYAEAWLTPRGQDPAVADAVTVNPYLGDDGIKPFLDAARAHQGGIFVLLRTSNPSSRQLQLLETTAGTLVDVLARQLNALNTPCDPTGYGPLGVVVGATHAAELAKARQSLKGSWILVPGYGAQGATAADVVHAFDARGRGAIINASRSLCTPWLLEKKPAPSDWRHRISEAAKSTRDALRDAKRVPRG